MQLKSTNEYSKNKSKLYKNDNHSRFIDLADYDSFSPVIPLNLIENSLLGCESKQIQSTSDSPLLA